MVELLAAEAIGYLLGSMPSGLLIGRWLRGVDIRESGSGRTGATATGAAADGGGEQLREPAADPGDAGVEGGGDADGGGHRGPRR